MSLSTVPLIQIRIKAASPASPIAVFKLAAPGRGQLEAVFGSTFATRRSVRHNNPLFVGYFHNDMDVDEVAVRLHDAAR